MHKLLFRTDASPEIGAGHLLRCLALAQCARRADVDTQWISYCPDAALRRRVEDIGVKTLWLDSPRHRTDLITDAQPDWAVLDGYNFDLRCQKSIRSTCVRLLTLDDHRHLASYDADIILNQNIGAGRATYNCPPGCVILRGLDYCLIREEFLKAAPKSRRQGAPRRILLTMGGSDPSNASLALMKALEICRPDAETTVLAGSLNTHKDKLHAFASKAETKFKVVEAVDDMSALLPEMDFVISAAGSTCWELCLLGLPMALVTLAGNQEPVAWGLEQADAAVRLADARVGIDVEKVAKKLSAILADSASMERRARTASKLVDGMGAKRVLRSIFPELEPDWGRQAG